MLIDEILMKGGELLCGIDLEIILVVDLPVTDIKCQGMQIF